jgi:hypothetical protein
VTTTTQLAEGDTLDTLPPSYPATPSVTTTTSIAEGAPWGVTGNENEGRPGSWQEAPAILTTEQLQDANWLPLSALSASPGAIALIADLVPSVAVHESTSGDRRTGRRQAGVKKLQAAVGAIVGGLLRRWGRDQPQAVFRTRKAEDFTGSPVGVRQFTAAMDGLFALGFVTQSKSIRYLFVDWGGGQTVYNGKAPRHWPSATLLSLAVHHGVTPATIATDFGDVIPTKPPIVLKPVQLFALKQRRQRDKLPLPLSKLGSDGHRIRQGIDEANTFAAEHEVRGCLPPRWYRVFVECLMLGGRWQAAGREGVYQVMREADRVSKITIDGEAVAEFDVKASHLSIMHGLLRLPLPEGDPYDIPDIPRSVVKAWITATLGKGSPVRSWAKKAIKRDPELGNHDAKHVGQLIGHRYPFMRDPARAVSGAAGLDRLERIGPPERLLTHRLMAIEAAAMTGAIEYLRTSRGVLALPVHDSLIVPQSGVGYVGGAFDGAFGYFAKVRVRWDMQCAPDIPPA